MAAKKEKEPEQAVNTVAIPRGDDRVPYTLPLTHNPSVDAYPRLYMMNGKDYLIPRGVEVMIPRDLKNRIEEIERDELKAYRFSQEKSLGAAARNFLKEYGVDVSDLC